MSCRESFPVSRSSCSVCAVPLMSAGICGVCLQSPPAYSRLYAPFVYDYPVDRLIKCFKHGDNFAAGLLLVQLWADYVKVEKVPLPDLLVPVPLHWWRQWQRGFNQSIWLAKRLSSEMKIPLDIRCLKRIRYARPQQLLTRRRRLKNSKNSFACRANLAGKRIVLLDDVVTTGATVENASRCLLDAGAVNVDIWCLARTPLVI